MVSNSVKLFFLSAVTLVSSARCVSYKLDFIPMKFDDFAQVFVVDKADLPKFKEFYVRVLDKREKSDSKQRAGLNRYLYRKALDFLQKNHADWYASLQPYIADPIITLNTEYNDIRTFIDTFLVRLGSLQEFQSKKLVQETKTQQSAPGGILERAWDTTKQYASTAKNTVFGWFGYKK